MQEIASTLPEYSVVREMKGVGDVLSVRLIGEIGDVRRFRNGSSLVAFAGIDAPPYESGKFVGTNRNISKRGSSTLRKIGYEIMHSLKVSKPTEDSAVYDFIIKKENEGKQYCLQALYKYFKSVLFYRGSHRNGGNRHGCK